MEFKTFEIGNSQLGIVRVLNYGARLIGWQPSGGLPSDNIIVGPSNIEDYKKDAFYMGAIAGPYANRIAGGHVEFEGKGLDLGRNEGTNHLHGGELGLEKVLWQVVEYDENKLTLEYRYSNKVLGHHYPGNIVFRVVYHLADVNELVINMSATTDELTVIGPTGHAYLTLNPNGQNIRNHELWLNAEHYTPVDEANIPTGEIKMVHDQFDYRRPEKLSASLDNNFVLNKRSESEPAAILKCSDTNVQLAVFTDYPGIQVYTADHLSTPFNPSQGVCLEPQFFPNAPNEKAFPFEFTTPEKPFNKTISYKLSGG